MYNPDAPLVSLEELKTAKKFVDESRYCRRTPLLPHMQQFFSIDENVDMYLKLENFQNTGSYKIRGTSHQFHLLPEDCGTEERRLVCLSAGNYGKAFSYMCDQLNLKGTVIMADTAPINRVKVIEDFGVPVEIYPSSQVKSVIDHCCAERNMFLCHSFDDPRVLAGHASAGLEILEDIPDPDIVVVCCGGGCLLAGIAASIKLSGLSQCKVYGVEPTGACTMFNSLKEGRPVGMEVKTVASGLAPPYAGPNSYKHVKQFADGILLVTDEELLKAMFVLYKGGLVVEPSGAAAFAALYHGKIPNVNGKKVVVVITGGNVTPDELALHSKSDFVKGPTL